MKHLLFITISFFFCNFIFGQQITNGGMEQWDSTSIYEFPIQWKTTIFWPSAFCLPDHNTAMKTSDKNSGSWAVELKAKECIEDGGVALVYIGFLAYGNNDNPYISSGIPYHDRPAQLNFYCKFKSIGNDTGFAQIILRLYDSTGYAAGQIIGEGNTSIINDIDNYTLITVPITYYFPDTPELLQIIFGTSKTLVVNNLLATSPGNGAYEGTTLWIDDATVSGGTIGMNDYQYNVNWAIYPNPFSNSTNLHITNLYEFTNQKTELVLYDVFGREVFKSEIKNSKSEIKRGNLPSGIYFCNISNKNNFLIMKKLIIIDN